MNRIAIVGIYALAAAFLVGCSSFFRHSFDTSDNRLLPLHPCFSLKGKASRPGHGYQIETNGVYLDTEINATTSKTNYGFYRFWADGHVMRKGIAMSREPIESEYDIFTDCDVGYYTLCENHLLIELYVPLNGGDYCLFEGTVGSNDILIERWWFPNVWPKHVEECRGDLIKKKAIYTIPKRMPDW